jgi:hypothetical protein
MASALKGILAQVNTKLTANSTLMALITAVSNWTAEDTVFPYVVIGGDDTTETKFNVFGKTGKESTIKVHIFSQYKGDSELLDIYGAVDDVLDDASLTLTGHTSVLISFENFVIIEEENKDSSITRHGIVTYRVITQES